MKAGKSTRNAISREHELKHGTPERITPIHNIPQPTQAMDTSESTAAKPPQDLCRPPISGL